MNDYSLGTLEEMILLVLLSEERTYGVEIAKQYESHFGHEISLPAIHVVLKRLEKKGFVKSEFGQPTSERGGRRKRMYEATKLGFKLASDLQEKRAAIWKQIPEGGLSYVKV